ncbi:MAG: DNA-deoxyinosine glycosylase [Flavobacterium sp.]|nr:MAG: DNA-deoxyinosine glycosylase [Flavobacterium sp.]
MTEIIRNRTIRPSSRNEKSKSYKIDTKQISAGDILVVNIDHEGKPFHRTYKFDSHGIANREFISFRVNDFGTVIEITWSGAQPIRTTENIPTSTNKSPTPKTKKEKITAIKNSSALKTSFNPISNSETRVLILGTLPSDKSLELNEYYGNSRNKFWKIISMITNNDLPLSYADKKKLLSKTKIGIWDVARYANRKGSLDNAIQNEEPNDLTNFIFKHKSLKIVGFNGLKAEALYDKYFIRQARLKYISLPSTSPANTGQDFDSICKIWRQILKL